eukprot:scaffold8450_cov215-Amphora_coffeaeformis.AAC.13
MNRSNLLGALLAGSKGSGRGKEGGSDGNLHGVGRLNAQVGCWKGFGVPPLVSVGVTLKIARDDLQA